jgi:hypothetical protein
MNSSVFEHWSDQDDYPVSARKYAHEVFAYSEDLEETPENIMDELDDYFGGRSNWRFADYKCTVAESIDTVSAWPFVVRRRVVMVLKFHDGVNGWQEKGYDLNTEFESLMEPAVDVKVFIEL